MHIHILGICGTFMGGLAVLAKEAGHTVTGCDANVYPPMSTQLQVRGIGLMEGFGVDQLALKPDLFVIGNVVARGNPLMEEILNRGLPYISGPQWMSEHILLDKWVLAVAGTHGKTTTATMLAWILEEAGYAPGFLIGGVPLNFEVSARLSDKKSEEMPFFVIEADEYDTAFFDKRSKFVHYRPRTVILNNLEYDHADIFPDLAAIETQFHHLIRTVARNGRLIINQQAPALQRVLQRGCWSEQEWFAETSGAEWTLGKTDASSFEVRFQSQLQGRVEWELTGRHNQLNALAAIAAARHVGIMPVRAMAALNRFKSVKRRMELRGEVRGIRVYDDFAHHPTAIETTLAGLRQKVGSAARILAVLEPRSNTMKLGSLKEALVASLAAADLSFGYLAKAGKNVPDWDLAETLAPLGDKAMVQYDVDQLAQTIAKVARSGDHILVMSNGNFGDIHSRILYYLK